MAFRDPPEVDGYIFLASVNEFGRECFAELCGFEEQRGGGHEPTLVMGFGSISHSQ